MLGLQRVSLSLSLSLSLSPCQASELYFHCTDRHRERERQRPGLLGEKTRQIPPVRSSQFCFFCLQSHNAHRRLLSFFPPPLSIPSPPSLISTHPATFIAIRSSHLFGCVRHTHDAAVCGPPPPFRSDTPFFLENLLFPLRGNLPPLSIISSSVWSTAGGGIHL